MHEGGEAGAQRHTLRAQGAAEGQAQQSVSASLLDQIEPREVVLEVAPARIGEHSGERAGKQAEPPPARSPARKTAASHNGAMASKAPRFIA